MISCRMCVSCRERKEKQSLIRIVKKDGKAVIDKSFKAQTRGAYVCKNESCISAAKKRRIFQRVLSCGLDDEFFEEMIQYGEKQG